MIVRHGEDTLSVIERVKEKLEELKRMGNFPEGVEYTVVGVRTTIPALLRIVGHPDFRAGRLSTAFLERVLPDLRPHEGRHASIATIAAAVAEYERGRRAAATTPIADGTAESRWRLTTRPGWTAS